MSKGLSSSAQRVQDALRTLGYDFTVVELEQSTRTSREAAAAVGCDVAQIAKSLVFRGRESGRAILVIASGVNRVDLHRLAAYAGEPVERADPEFVREVTGFAIGGVPPVGHKEPLQTYIDEDLLRHDVIWAAAGTPRALFRLTPQALVDMTRGRVVPIKETGR